MEDQINHIINAIHLQPRIDCLWKNVLRVRALYNTGVDVTCMNADVFKRIHKNQ